VSTPDRIRVLVVDDDRMAAAGISAILGTTADIEVVGTCADGTEVRSAVDAHHPDVVLCDVRMPSMDGVAVVRRLHGSNPDVHFLMMTAFDEDGRVLEAIGAGADGFLLKDDDPTRIIDAIRAVAAGDAAFSPRAARQLTEWVQDSRTADLRRDAQAKLAMLTEREREYALATVTGASDSELASRFFVSETTIKSALTSIRTKWGVRTRTDVAVVVARAGN
jgi:DNA-binding NarL/FixJ family response regulator